MHPGITRGVLINPHKAQGVGKKFGVKTSGHVAAWELSLLQTASRAARGTSGRRPPSRSPSELLRARPRVRPVSSVPCPVFAVARKIENPHKA